MYIRTQQASGVPRHAGALGRARRVKLTRSATTDQSAREYKHPFGGRTLVRGTDRHNWGTRQPDGLSFDVALEEPIPHGDPVAMIKEATRRLEARVRARPGQWFWVHRRWKATPSQERAS